MSYQEFMQHISLVRLGLAMGFRFTTPPPKADVGLALDFNALNQLTLLMQPAHVQLAGGKKLSPHERDAFRADYLRKKLV